MTTASPVSPPIARQALDPMSGAQIAVESLVRHGVEVMFAYPGGQSIPLHQALTRYRDRLRVVLPRHEQGGGFAAQGYARSTGRVGVCMATSGPGATNLVTAIADAKLDSVPLVAITGQVPTRLIGFDAFQETPIASVCQGITKHHCLVTDVRDVARAMREAFYVAQSGRPGPVLVDLPRDVQLATTVPDFEAAMDLPGYRPEPCPPSPSDIAAIAVLLSHAKRPVICVGGGVISSGASADLTAFARELGIPVATTLMGIGAFPGDDPLSLDLLGMHGSVYANYAVHECDLLLAFGVRFGDRVTGRVSAFAAGAKVVHVDLDAAEINKVKRADVAICGDVGQVLRALRASAITTPDLGPWRERIAERKLAEPFACPTGDHGIAPQQAIRTLWEMTRDRDAIIATGVGQHQMWTAQHYKFSQPRRLLTSSGLGTMGFGLPAAMGAKLAHPESLVVDIDGDGSLLMNLQEMATCYCEHVPVKVMVLNNQHLGMVAQLEDRFHDSNRAQTFLGPIDRAIRPDGEVPGGVPDRYPDFPTIARGFGWQTDRVDEPAGLRAAIARMIDAPGPYLLDVTLPWREHVLPMIPAGMTVEEVITR